MPAPASRPAESRGALLSIGQVLRLLGDEFPELSHSKLHYLEAEELIRPQRTASGYRKYTHGDVDRIVFILRAQRDRFWPLKVIKEHLREHGVDDGAVTSIASRPGPSAQIRPVRLDRRGLAREAHVEEEFLCELEQFGLLDDGLVRYGAAELEITRSARALAEQGLHPRHLVMLRTSAQRQAHMIGSVTRPHGRGGSSAARGEAEDLARDLGESMISLHSALLRTALRGD